MSLFRRMLREEWRMHADLFGSARFGLFPVFVFAVATGSYVFFALAGADPGAIVAGVHGLAFAFGLHVGTVGLVGRDAIENLLGDVTLLLFSARTLPVSWTRLLAAFLLKDAVYYVALFVTPLALGLVPLGLYLGEGTLPLLVVARAWATATATFVLGMALSVALVGLYTRSRAGVVGATVALAAAVAAVGDDLLRLSPYGLYAEPSSAAAFASLAGICLLSTAGIALVRPDRSRPAGTTSDRFSAIRAVVGDGLLAKSLLDVSRSSGGLGKVAVSQVIVFGVVVVVLENVTRILPVRPAGGIAFGGLLALGSFTTYNWLTGFDDARAYLRYPVAFAAVLRAKFRAFLALSLPVSAGLLGLAGAWFGSDALPIGGVLVVGLSVYLFGVTAYLTGLSPNELLFDTPLFAAFAAALAAVLIPTLIGAFAYATAPTTVTAALVLLAAVAAALGYALYRAAAGKWERRLREG